MSHRTQSVTAVRDLPPNPKVSIAKARQISRAAGSEIHWRPLNLDEQDQFAVVMNDGERVS